MSASSWRILRAPLATGLALMLLLAAWGYSEATQMHHSRQERVRRHGELFTLFVAAALTRELTHGLDGLDPERAHAVLSAMQQRSPGVRGVALSLPGHDLVQLGEPVPEDDALRAHGESLHPVRLALCRRLSADAPTLAIRPPEPDTALTQPCQPDAPALLLSMDRAAPPWHQTVRGRGLLVRLALSLAVILTMMWSWAMGLRHREVASALAVERGRRAHLEELSVAAAGLAHETRNPLGIIRGLAQRILHGPDAATTARLAEQIVDAADIAQARLGEFLNFARLQQPQRVIVSPQQLTREVIEALRYDFDEAKVPISSRGECPEVWADAIMLKQALVNLLLNSLAASAPGQPVELVWRCQHQLASVEVIDAGRGVPPEIREDVFKPYVTGREDGHGLGLAIVRRIAEAHDWTLTLDDRQPQGTVVRLGELRVATPHEEDA